jgi:mRNA interferase HigB
MRIISRRKLKAFWETHREAEQPLKAWFAVADKAEWRNFADIKASFNSVDRVGERLVFNVGGNKFRLVAVVDFERHGVLIRFVGTHKEYDNIDPSTV